MMITIQPLHCTKPVLKKNEGEEVALVPSCGFEFGLRTPSAVLDLFRTRSGSSTTSILQPSPSPCPSDPARSSARRCGCWGTGRYLCRSAPRPRTATWRASARVQQPGETGDNVPISLNESELQSHSRLPAEPASHRIWMSPNRASRTRKLIAHNGLYSRRPSRTPRSVERARPMLWSLNARPLQSAPVCARRLHLPRS